MGFESHFGSLQMLVRVLEMMQLVHVDWIDDTLIDFYLVCFQNSTNLMALYKDPDVRIFILII